MRVALRGARGPRRKQAPVRSARATSWPAPVQGWDTETPVAELPPTRAIVCDNWIPHGIQLEMRRGCETHASDIDDAVETLMPYNRGASSKLFAAAGAEVFDATSPGAVGAAVLSGMNSARWSFVNFQTAGGTFLWAVTDSVLDAPVHWNGAAWAPPTLNIVGGGFTAADIFYVFASKERLFVLFDDSLTFGYLAVDSIAGDVTKFPLGSVFTKGGHLVAGGRLSRDNGDGMDDFTVFVTSEGEVAVYAGNNPSDADEWAKVGMWNVGEPVGARPIVDLGTDIGIITRNGLVSLLRVMSGAGDVDPEKFPYITERIATPFRERARTNPSNTLWQGQTYPSGDLLIINAPSGNSAQQFVRHRITGGWSRFTGWNFACFALFGGRLYAGGLAGDVFLCDEGYADDGEDIVADLQWPWSALGSRGAVKQMVKARPIVTTQTGASVALVARSDYADIPALPAADVLPLSDGLVWGEGLWDDGRWGGRSQGARKWRTISAVGHAISIALRARSRQSKFTLNGLDMIFNIGGPV